jgi:hypothetical protein
MPSHKLKRKDFDVLADLWMIEKNWHCLKGSYDSSQEPLIDANNQPFTSAKYVIDIWYKLIVPSNIDDNKDNDLAFISVDPSQTYYDMTRLIRTLDIPGFFNLSVKDTSDKKYYDHYMCGVTTSVDEDPINDLLALPSASELGYSADVPVGSEFRELGYYSYIDGKQTKNKKMFYGYNGGGLYFGGSTTISSRVNNPSFLNLIDTPTADPNTEGTLTVTTNADKDSIQYIIYNTPDKLGVPFTLGETAATSYIGNLPILFRGFIMKELSKNGSGTTIENEVTGALYLCLGVHEI